MQIKFFIPTIIVLKLLFVFSSQCFGQAEAIKKSLISIEDAAICRGVVEREPIEPGEVFPADIKKLFCFSKVTGALEDTEVIHVWYYKGKLVSRTSLRVKSVNWRTYSSITIAPEDTGEWKVEILTKDGELLKQIYFAVN